MSLIILQANGELVEEIINRRPREGDAHTWTLQFRDLPEVVQPGRRQVTSRLMADVQISSGDPIEFMEALDYTYVTPRYAQYSHSLTDYDLPQSHIATYLLAGHRFTHLSTSILLYRLFLPANPFKDVSNGPSREISKARLLDPSGTYILQAAVRVQDGSKVETMTKGSLELLSLKETLKGVVELDMGDRLALDTRVR